MNIDAAEVSKFNELASRWWDPEGDFKPLHDINPLRLQYLLERTDVTGKRAIDVGCGGGILAESLAAAGANVTGIDMAERPLGVARLHAQSNNVAVDYRQNTAEAQAQEQPGHYDIVTCLEMLEHVPDYSSTVAACAALAKPGAHLLFSTINRHPKAYLLTVLGAEYVLNLLPKGTHTYSMFIKPSELAAAARAAGLEVEQVIGMRYNPFNRKASLHRDVDTNYLLYARKPA
ncbi:MAG: bifunctional 2-polyprenyl-6-hydroxyphenol methylase/3-demethylubiquinol 3-O-methyltransferase UbiG [Pseudomonadales bacterium]